MSELKVNDTLEALFEVDSKWYRVEVRSLKPLDIYFLDFGNSQTIAQLVPKTLRYRLKFESDSQTDLFNLDYQAIRCRYESNTENRVSQFLEKISQIEDIEAGFELTVLESNPQHQQQDSYLVTLDQDHKQRLKQEPKIEEKIEEEKIEEKIEEEMEEGKASIQLESGSVIDEVSFVHIESISEFYVQTQDTLRLFIDFQAKIQRLLELMLSNKSSQENKQELFKKGDFVFGKFLSDMNWYRAVIISIEENSGQKSELSELANDGRLYDVYFLDYGNKQENLPSSLLYSFDSVKQLNKNLNLMAASELNSIIEMPFQAICCQLVDKKNNTRNNEVLKSLLLECLNFSIKIADTSKQKILDNLEIDKYLVYLSTDGKCLQDQFEDELKVEKCLISPNGVYECKLSNLDKDIYVNLIDQVDEFLKLETLLTSDEKIVSKWRSDATPNLADLVLARYVLDEQTSTWCRARITKKINNVFDVFFIDYGNESLHLSLEDLAPLGALYSLSKYPPFAHKIQLRKIQIDVQKHGQHLSQFLDENFKIKVLSVEQEELCCCLVVELWDSSMSKCLNEIIDEETLSDKIEQTNVHHLYSANKTSELKVNVNYAFMDDLLKPFYFCLSDDLASRCQLDSQLNQFYSTNDEEASHFALNAYIAVHSDNSWYRAQIKQMLDTNSIFVFYIDYGFDELIELTEQNKKQKLRKLHAKFYQYPRFVFGAALLNPMAAKADSYELINFESNDNQTLRQTLEHYFTASDSEQFDLVILCKLSATRDLSQNFMPNEDYYGIEMYNADAMCLNEMIVASKHKKATKPASIRLTIEQIPKQKPLNDQYYVFARAPDHFYVYNEERVLQVQVKTQETCANILQQLEEYEKESQEEERIQVDDLVYAKYDDEETWYRCRVTNCDRESGKFELFYLDFGNVEIVSGSDVLTGWSEHHLQPFVSYEPQAYKCTLYGLANKEYSLEEKNKFKQFTSDKVFDVSFIKVNADRVNEVGLQIGDKSETNVHMFCIGQGIAGLGSFDTILKSKRTSEENKFYINLLSGF
ncbi:maternal tudor isoform X1 [Brachionus plicatilis]|uniref:Maternal tudor isoform X1 n=1 Tax=Brachionus plicatilis TaxID=10195 RepID=A0A3M7R3R8_BRAPC|nr:maternal tudor isoform X1 [Brachionus plicatilis]